MVNLPLTSLILLPGRWLPLAEAAADTSVLERLDPPRRAQVIMVLLGLVLLGVLLMALVWLGGRYVRRIAAARPTTPRPLPDAWARKPLQSDRPAAPGAHESQ